MWAQNQGSFFHRVFLATEGTQRGHNMFRSPEGTPSTLSCDRLPIHYVPSPVGSFSSKGKMLILNRKVMWFLQWWLLVSLSLHGTYTGRNNENSIPFTKTGDF